MTMSIIVAANTIVHSTIMRMMTMSRTIGADWMMVVVCIAVIPIQMICYAVIWMPPAWPIIPIIWRMPCHPMRAPKPVIDHWSINIYWFNNVIRTIYIFVTYHLYCHLFIIIFLHINRCHILIDILCQYSLYYHQVTTTICCLHYTQVIHIAIAIQIQVGQC